MKGVGDREVGDTWGGWGTFGGGVEGYLGRGTRGMPRVGNGHTFGLGELGLVHAGWFC